MKVFDHYSQYYDLFYSNKNYDAEVDYVDELIQEYCPSAKTILDLGCGTGTHDFYFAKKGYEVVGVDLSDRMISIAKEKQKTADDDTSFLQGDIRYVSIEKEFDIVVSLFHVFNYLTLNADMIKGFSNALKHLKQGGVFIFDCWYGPAVLYDLPKNGTRRLKNDVLKATRIVEPVIHPNENIVDVNYEIFIEEIATSKVEVIHETHSVRYLFKTEIESILVDLGAEIVCSEEWLTKKELGFDTFGACFVIKKNS